MRENILDQIKKVRVELFTSYLNDCLNDEQYEEIERKIDSLEEIVKDVFK